MKKYLHTIFARQTLLAFTCLLFSHFGIAAPTVHFGPTPAWVVPIQVNDRQPDLRNVNDGFYLKLYEEVENVAAQASYTHVIREIFSDAGVQGASDISINFNPAYEQLTVHQITVWRNGKPTDKLHNAPFKVIATEANLSRYIYNGNYTAYLIMADIRKGDKIEYAYTITGENPVFNGKFFRSFGFQATNPIGHVHCRLIAPTTRNINFKYFNNAAKPTVAVTGGNTIYDWDLPDAKGLESTGNTPSWYEVYAYVQVSEYNQWGEVVDWAFRINTPDSSLKGALRERVAELRKKYAGDEERLFRAIVDIVQNEVRYMGVEIGRYSHKANSPAKVYEQRYGDCKDKALLMVSMLRAVGIGADMALVNSSSKKAINNKLPSPSAFNHAIAVAHLPGRDVWVDGTISYQGGMGADIYCPDYGYALVLKPGADALTAMPALKGGSIKYREEYVAKDAKEPVQLTVYTDYDGSKADDIRVELANQSKSDLEKGYLDYYARKFPHIEAGDTISIVDDKEMNTLRIIERYTITDFFDYDSAANNYTASFYASMIRNMLPDITQKMNYPIAVSFPYEIDFTVNLSVPIMWSVTPTHNVINRNSYSFTGDASAEGNTLSLHYKFAYLRDHIAQEDLRQYEKDRKKLINDHLSYSITYTDGAAVTHSGVNYLMVLAFIVLLGGCAYMGVYIYKTPTTQRAFGHPYPGAIGGWMILPIIGLTIAAIRSMYTVFSTGLLNNAVWHVYDGQPNATAIQVLLFVELAGNVLTSAYAVFCLVLLFKKRDILPRHAIIFYVGTTGIVLLDAIGANILIPGDEVDYKNIYRSVVAACIWGTYFARSQRVKEVFVVPYFKEGSAQFVEEDEQIKEEDERNEEEVLPGEQVL